MNRPFAWSFSALSKYETCPYQYYRMSVAKDVKDKQNEAATWGNEVHKKLEHRVGNKVALPTRFKQYEKYAAPFDKFNGVVIAEQKLTLNRDLRPTGWFSKDAWCRGIIDVTALNAEAGKAGLFDWKTGKRKPDSLQLMLFAAMAFAHYPEVDRADTAFVWLKEKAIDKETYTRDQEKDIWDTFNRKLRPMQMSFNNNKWPKKPSGLCKGWCQVKDCTYWEPAKT